jgi:LemA protein
MVPIVILLVLLLAVIGGFIGVYNGLVALRNQVKNAWQQIGVQLKRRHDLIPNLVEVVKDYMGYEQETLEKVIRARNQALQATGVRGTAAAEAELSGALRSLFAVVEAYPQLKANENVSRLQEELTSTENRIAFARQFYNDMVMRYNTRLQVIPSNVVASLFNFREESYFEIPAAEQEPVKVDLR